MATKKKEVEPLKPVSAKENFDMVIFPSPQNGMLGSANASDRVNGKLVQVAHAYLFENGPDISLGKIGGKKATFEDIERLQEVLTLFTQKVKEFYAKRNAA